MLEIDSNFAKMTTLPLGGLKSHKKKGLWVSDGLGQNIKVIQNMNSHKLQITA